METQVTAARSRRTRPSPARSCRWRSPPRCSSNPGRTTYGVRPGGRDPAPTPPGAEPVGPSHERGGTRPGSGHARQDDGPQGAGRTMKLSDYVVQFIADLGVKHVFLLPGGGAMHLNDSLGKIQGAGVRLQRPRAGRGDRRGGVRAGRRPPGRPHGDDRPGGQPMPSPAWRAHGSSTPLFFISGQVKPPTSWATRGVRQLGIRRSSTSCASWRRITKFAGRRDGPRCASATILEKAAWQADARPQRAPSGSTSRWTCRPPRSTRTQLDGFHAPEPATAPQRRRRRPRRRLRADLLLHRRNVRWSWSAMAYMAAGADAGLRALVERKPRYSRR